MNFKSETVQKPSGRITVERRAWPRATALSLALALLAAGCRVVETATEMPAQAVRAVTPGRTDVVAVNPEEVQHALLRFADEFSAQVSVGVDQLRRGTNAIRRAESLKWKTALGTETCSLASGPSPVANLLDLTVFVTVIRMALEEQWQPNIFGESAQPLLASCRDAEAKIWLAVGRVLTPQQQGELRGAIVAWRRQHPLPDDVLAAPSVGFVSSLAAAERADAAKAGSLFSLLKVDPLADMEPAVREVARSRLLAERALFVTQKLPMLLRWQTELLGVNATELPAVQQLVTNSTQLAASVERFALAAEKLPGQLSTERAEILRALETQERALTPLVNEVRQTLTAGLQMSSSLNTTFTTFDALMQRFGVGESNRAATKDPQTEPFRIQDYGQTAGQLEAAARQLTELLNALDQTLGSTNLARLSAQVGPAVQQAQTGGRELVDYAFRKGVLLVLLALVAGLIYRSLAGRIGSAKPIITPLP